MTNQRRAARRSTTRDETVELGSVEAGQGKRSAHLPEDEGPYTFVIRSVTRETGNDSGKPYLLLQCVVKDGDYKGKKVYHNCSLQPKALFNLKNVLLATGQTALAERTLKVSQIIKALTGKSFDADVEDDEYNGKVKSVLADFVLDAPKKKRAAPVEDDEDEDEEDEEDEDTEDEDEDEDEEDEEPAPVRRRAATKAPVKPTRKAAATAKSKSAAKRRAADDDDDDEDLDDIELDDL